MIINHNQLKIENKMTIYSVISSTDKMTKFDKFTDSLPKIFYETL